eukprot:765007-Hanusia_phi.AAC.3
MLSRESLRCEVFRQRVEEGPAEEDVETIERWPDAHSLSPVSRDDRLRQVCEKADLERKREAIGRCCAKMSFAKEVLSPARPDGMSEQDAMKDGLKDHVGKAQNAVTSGLLDILKLAESMGTLDEEPKGIKKEEVKTTGDEAAKSVGWEGEAGTFDDCDVMMLAEESSNKLFAPGEMRRLNQDEVGNEFLNPASVISRYDWKDDMIDKLSITESSAASRVCTCFILRLQTDVGRAASSHTPLAHPRPGPRAPTKAS